MRLQPQSETKRIDKTTWVLGLACAVGAAGLITFPPHIPTRVQYAEVSRQGSSSTNEGNLTRYPVTKADEAISAARSLPTLKESDAALQESLGRLFDPIRLGDLIIPGDMINRFVVTVDNLARAKLPLQQFPTLPAPGQFMIKGEAGGVSIDPENYKRYTRYVQFVQEVDTQRIVSIYFHFYPLFQEAYSALGYKSGYFNDRLVEVIDHLLAAPNVGDPVQLVQPSVFYKFADPRLEGLSAGQKLLIRIGSGNAKKIKEKLREFRHALTNRGAITR